GTISNNYISGNGQAGVHLYGDGGTAVSGNRIGTDNAGVLAQGNRWGVILDFSYGADVHDNVISGNLYGGVVGTYDNGSQIRNNKIGTDISGMAAIANGSGGGISLNSSSNTSIVNNTVSGNLGGGI